MNEIANRFEQITDRHPVRVPVPETIASLGVDLAEMVGVKIPLNEAMLKMLVEENVVRDPEGNEFCILRPGGESFATGSQE